MAVANKTGGTSTDWDSSEEGVNTDPKASRKRKPPPLVATRYKFGPGGVDMVNMEDMVDMEDVTDSAPV